MSILAIGYVALQARTVALTVWHLGLVMTTWILSSVIISAIHILNPMIGYWGIGFSAAIATIVTYFVALRGLGFSQGLEKTGDFRITVLASTIMAFHHAFLPQGPGVMILEFQTVIMMFAAAFVAFALRVLFNSSLDKPMFDAPWLEH